MIPTDYNPGTINSLFQQPVTPVPGDPRSILIGCRLPDDTSDMYAAAPAMVPGCNPASKVTTLASSTGFPPLNDPAAMYNDPILRGMMGPGGPLAPLDPAAYGIHNFAAPPTDPNAPYNINFPPAPPLDPNFAGIPPWLMNAPGANFGPVPAPNFGPASGPNFGPFPAPNFGPAPAMDANFAGIPPWLMNAPGANFGPVPAPNFGPASGPNFSPFPAPNFGPAPNPGNAPWLNNGPAAPIDYSLVNGQPGPGYLGPMPPAPLPQSTCHMQVNLLQGQHVAIDLTGGSHGDCQALITSDTASFVHHTDILI